MRGQKQAADNQLKKTNAVGDQYNGQAGEIGGFTEPRYKTLADSGYFSPAEEAAATNSVMGGAAAPFQAAKFEANNTAARTNNAADLTANQDQLALSEGRTAGEAADQLQNDKMKNQLQGMYGLSGMRQEDLNAMESMYGLGPGTLEARAAGGGWSQGFHDVTSGVGDLLRGVGSLGQNSGNGGGGSGSCWIAETIYGADDDRTHLLRHWLNNVWARESAIGSIIMRLYSKIGRWVARHPKICGALKPLFEMALTEAVKWQAA